MDRTPRWLERIEKPLGWIALPNIAIIFVTLQALGLFFILSNPEWSSYLALFPEAVKAGEFWRLITFLALPMSTHPLWMLLVLWFLWFILNSLETQWGAFKTTFYVFVSLVLTICFSLIFNYPVVDIRHFESTLFLAAAILYPNLEVNLFLVFPVKLKWLALFSGALIVIEFIGASWLGRFYLVAIYSNFLLFFGPAGLWDVKNAYRRWKFKRRH